MKKKFSRDKQRTRKIMRELNSGFALVKKVKKAVSFFGSKRTKPGDKYYKAARELARRLALDDFAIITGGGPGIMEAANRGAHDAKGKSIGMGIEIEAEKEQNKYVDEGITFYYFFTRKVMLSAPAQAYVFLPGGFGTFDEFFELITLIQTGKTRRIPVVLYGKKFWKPLYDYMYKHLYKEWGVINRRDLKFLLIVDSVDEAYDIIHKSKSRRSI